MTTSASPRAMTFGAPTDRFGMGVTVGRAAPVRDIIEEARTAEHLAAARANIERAEAAQKAAAVAPAPPPAPTPPPAAVGPTAPARPMAAPVALSHRGRCVVLAAMLRKEDPALTEAGALLEASRRLKQLDTAGVRR